MNSSRIFHESIVKKKKENLNCYNISFRCSGYPDIHHPNILNIYKVTLLAKLTPILHTGPK